MATTLYRQEYATWSYLSAEHETDNTQTPVSQSHWFVHRDEEIFPDPDAFIPERWMGDKKSWDRLTKHMVSFTKGSRQCMGLK